MPKTETTMVLPRWECYVDYASQNYGLNALRFTHRGWTLWFSYRTLVAFEGPNSPRVVHENDWAQTTGRHLNAIDGGDKRNRVDAETFERAYAKAF